LEAEQALERVITHQTDLSARLAGIEEERRSVLEEARKQAQTELEGVQEEIAVLRRKLAVAGQPLEALHDAE
jgi:hypothetical protein